MCAIFLAFPLGEGVAAATDEVVSTHVANHQKGGQIRVKNTDKQPIDHKPPRPQTLDDLFAAYQGDYHPTEIDTGADVGLERIS